jgi:hypothetical protein
MEAPMALQNITSGPFEALLIRTSRKSIKNTIIEGANPRMYSAMLQVISNPNHVKKLNLESATELIALLDDAEMLTKVCEADKRVYVKEAVNRRLVDIGALPAPQERTRYVPTLSPAVTQATKSALRKPYDQAMRTLTNARQYDESLVATWADTVEVKALPSVMSFISRNNYYFSTGLLAKSVAKRLSAVTTAELNQLLRGQKVPSTVFEAYMTVRPRVIDEAAAIMICHADEYAVAGVLLSDENKPRYTVSNEAVELWKHIPAATRYLLFAGVLSISEITKLLDTAEYGDTSNRSNMMRYARNATDVDFVVAEALRRDWWPATEAYFSYAYSTSEISAFLSVQGISEATALAITSRATNAHAVRYALGEWGTPYRSAYEKVLSKISLNRMSWFSDFDSTVSKQGNEQALLGFARDLIAESTTLVEEVRQHYYSHSQNLLHQAVADALYETLGENTVSWSMFLSLCEDAADVTLLDLAEAASSLV